MSYVKGFHKYPMATHGMKAWRRKPAAPRKPKSFPAGTWVRLDLGGGFGQVWAVDGGTRIIASTDGRFIPLPVELLTEIADPYEREELAS